MFFFYFQLSFCFFACLSYVYIYRIKTKQTLALQIEKDIYVSITNIIIIDLCINERFFQEKKNNIKSKKEKKTRKIQELKRNLSIQTTAGILKDKEEKK